MPTLATLADRVQVLLNDPDATIWSQLAIEQWLVDGLREYSIHFPRTRYISALTQAGLQKIELPEDFIAVLEVEFPRTDDPPHRYLQRLARTHPDFWQRDCYYDVEASNANPGSLSTLYLSAVPNGESLGITYAAYHVPMEADGEPSTLQVTVANQHEHIIEQYAVWQAHVHRLATEVQNPDLTIRLMQQYKLAVQATETSYRTSLREAMKARASSGWTGPWKSDVHDRIY
ncbi:MAG: hypothetical protein GX597_00250 [Anaerolineaceae bacterium]|nr:hypothetical protein [Anaerolineaceae bacterium]